MEKMKKSTNRKGITYLTISGSVFSLMLSVIMFSEFNDMISALIFWVIAFINICVAWQINPDELKDEPDELKADHEETFSKIFENKKLFFEDCEGKRSPISYVDEEDDNIIVFKE